MILVLARPAEAGEVEALVKADPGNRSAAPEIVRRIAKLLAARTSSAAVRERAKAVPKQGRLVATADELLADVGAAAPRDPATGG